MAKQAAKKSQKSDIAALEEELITTWKKENTFQRSIDSRKKGQHFEFYDGPPFANGLPHYGHAISSIVKDAIPRYKTMRGYYVPRRFGWDCHGLPAEMKAEQDLDLGSKAAIEEYGVKKFVDYCRHSVTEFTKEWEYYVNRLGRWVDFEDNYYTMDEAYMESVMWAFKQLYDKGLVNEGFKVVPYCHVCETSLSNFETRQDDSYRERTDPGVTVRFPLESGDTLLAWTTTPWTLPANLAVAVNAAITYSIFEGNGERLVIAKEAQERFADQLSGYKKIGTKKGSKFVGLRYRPPFDYFEGHANSHVVLHGDFVSAEDGTGIAHEAPGFGEEDQELCEAHGIEVVVPVDKQGNYTKEITAFVGMNVFDANKHVIDHLKNAGLLFKLEDYTHSYPHCWRTDNPLIYRGVSSWMIDVPKLQKELLAANDKINWAPENVKYGAFGKWLESVRVWNVSRDRYWGTPIPVWKTEDGEALVIGSMKELQQYAVDPSKITDLHKPDIDNVVLKTKSGKLAYRVPEILDVWFDSGSMPFAQHNFPFSNKDTFKHPADFIVEYIGQVRGWFYTLHVLSVALFGKQAFNNVVSHGVILGSDNRKMSKRLGNYPNLQHVFNTYGADSLRYYLFDSPVISGETVAIDEKAIIDVHRNVFMTLLNSYRFFSTYASLDNWQPSGTAIKHQPNVTYALDKWILARLNQTIEQVSEATEEYEIPKAVRPIRLLIEDISNWYIRRSRKRFWKSEDDEDKQHAYQTLWYVLFRTSQVLAPWAPFMSDYIYRNITKVIDMPDSVHLTDWPEAESYNSDILTDMKQLRALISDGLAIRAEAGIKLRQPLQSATFRSPSQFSKELQAIAADELNVHTLNVEKSDILGVSIDLKISRKLELEGIARDIIRHVQNARKRSGLDVEDRIKLGIKSKDKSIMESLAQHKDEIQSETLTTTLDNTQKYTHKYEVNIATRKVSISLQKSDAKS